MKYVLKHLTLWTLANTSRKEKEMGCVTEKALDQDAEDEELDQSNRKYYAKLDNYFEQRKYA